MTRLPPMSMRWGIDDEINHLNKLGSFGTSSVTRADLLRGYLSGLDRRDVTRCDFDLDKARTHARALLLGEEMKGARQ